MKKWLRDLLPLWMFLLISSAACTGAFISYAYIEPEQVQPAKQVVVTKYVDRRLEDQVLADFIEKWNPKLWDKMTHEIISIIRNKSSKYNLPPVLIAAMIKKESEFNFFAVSNKKARGLGQINYAVWKEELSKLGLVEDGGEIYDPEKNIEAMCYILRHYVDKEKDLKKGVTKYLGGDVDKYWADLERSMGELTMNNVSLEVLNEASN